MTFGLFCEQLEHLFLGSWMFLEEIDFQFRLTLVILLATFLVALFFSLSQRLLPQILILLPFRQYFRTIIDLHTLFLPFYLLYMIQCVTDESNLNGSSTLLLHQYHIWFLHSGLVEIRHRWRVLVLFIFILPVFDECVYLLLRGLYLVQGLWPLIHCFYLGKLRHYV